MRINDVHNILELIKQDVLYNEAEYLKLLKVVGNNQRYDFRSQLSIYDKNPEVTACAKLIICVPILWTTQRDRGEIISFVHVGTVFRI